MSTSEVDPNSAFQEHASSKLAAFQQSGHALQWSTFWANFD